jgi:hypothetical protein
VIDLYDVSYGSWIMIAVPRFTPLAMTADVLDRRLQSLLAQACGYPSGSMERQKVLTEFLAVVEASGKLWRGAGADRDLYAEALNETWLYLLQRIESYAPERATVMTWINFYLKNRLKDIQLARQKAGDRKVDWGAEFHPWEMLPDPNSNPWQAVEEVEEVEPQQGDGLMDLVELWLENDRGLRRMHVLDRPDVNGAVVIADRLPPPKPWKQMALELQVKADTLTNFYYKRCLPELRSFLKSKGFR